MRFDNEFYVLRVKLWIEQTTDSDQQTDTPEWRGEIYHIETGEKAYFRHLSGFQEGLKKIGIDYEGAK